MNFSITEFFPGMGTLCAAFASGLSRYGSVSVAGAAELDGRYLSMFSKQHPEASTFLGSVTQYAPEEISTSRRGLKFYLAGVPCVGASLAGRSKNAISSAEMHSSAGHLFLPTLHFIARHMPSCCVFENVPQYAKTFSAKLIREYLASLGYKMTEYVVNPFTDFETATERIRWIMVASRIGVFEWNYTPKAFAGTIEHLLDPESVADRADEFSAEQVAAHTRYCDRKASEGCGFSRRILERTSTKVPTIPKSYGKIQPTGVFLRSGETYRLLRPREVARIHGFGPKFITMIERLPKTTAYEVLGQGVVARPFEALGAAIGEWVSTKSALLAA
jgi:DNA (cytosine-5)-methyltransferase 1